MRVGKVGGVRFLLVLLLLRIFHVGFYHGSEGKRLRRRFWEHHHTHDLTVIVIAEGPIVTNFLFCLDWLKLNVDFVPGSSQLIIILLLSGIAPYNFSILTCASNSRQPLRLETSESFLTPPFPSPPITTGLQVRIYLVKCVLELILSFHPSCHPVAPKSNCFMPGFLQLLFQVSSSDNSLKHSSGLSSFNSSLRSFQDLHNLNSPNFQLCSAMPVIKETVSDCVLHMPYSFPRGPTCSCTILNVYQKTRSHLSLILLLSLLIQTPIIPLLYLSY